MVERYALFLQDLPTLCSALRLDPDDLAHGELVRVVAAWLKKNPGHLEPDAEE